MLEGLNEQQKAAVLEQGHILLTACPGSGKTRVLAYKIAHELTKIRDSKKRIVALTFTNRAAEEIKKRLIYLDVDLPKLWAGTIHSFCLEWILRPYSLYLDELKDGFVIADEYKSEELVSRLKKEYGFKWWERITTQRNADGTFTEPKPQYADLLKCYTQLLEDEKLIDFDLVLYYAYKLLDTYPKIGKTLNNLFHLMCVDEYQDTQELQYAILSKMFAIDNSRTLLFMVGDKDQAIYGSLGGVAKSLEEVKLQFGNINIKEMELSGNYRSSQRVIDYYRNYQSTDIDIQSLCDHAGEHGLITLNNDVHRDHLAEHISEIIRRNIESGIPEHEICVLAPQWRLVIPMGRKLKAILPNVNFDAVGLSPLFRNKENTWFKFARLFLVHSSPKTYLIRSRWAIELIDEFEQLGIDVFPNVEQKSKSLLRLINSITSDEDDGLAYLDECFKSLLHALDLILEEYVALKQHWEFFFEGSRKRMADMELDYAKDITSFRRLFNHNTGVVVNTCHGIKGEEFQTVIAFGLLHGYIPNWNEIDGENSSRRLLYVICSRSKKYLHLIAENGRITNKGNPYSITEHLRNTNFPYD